MGKHGSVVACFNSSSYKSFWLFLSILSCRLPLYNFSFWSIPVLWLSSLEIERSLWAESIYVTTIYIYIYIYQHLTMIFKRGICLSNLVQSVRVGSSSSLLSKVVFSFFSLQFFILSYISLIFLQRIKLLFIFTFIFFVLFSFAFLYNSLVVIIFIR